MILLCDFQGNIKQASFLGLCYFVVSEIKLVVFITLYAFATALLVLA